MSRGRVAVLFVHPLFGQGLAQLLHRDDHLDVTCVRADPACAPGELKHLRPHAIVIEECDDEGFMRDLLRDLPPALLIRVRLQDNLMDVYYNRQVVAAGPDDLLEAIHLGLKRRPRSFVNGA